MSRPMSSGGLQHAAFKMVLPKRRCLQRYPVLATVEWLFDFTALTLAWYLTIELRLVLNPYMQAQLRRGELKMAAPPLAAILILWGITKYWLDRNHEPQTRSSALYTMRFAKTIILVSTVTIVSAFFSQSFGASVSRSFVILFSVSSYLLLLLTSSLEHGFWVVLIGRWPSLVERVAVLGRPQDLTAVSPEMWRMNGAVLTGIIVPSDCKAPESKACGAVRVLGNTGQVAEVINRERLDRVISLNGSISEDEWMHCAAVLHRMGVVTSQAIASHAWSAGEVALSTEFGLHMLEWRPISFTRGEELIKRVFDIAVSLILLLVGLPFAAIVALLIKLTSPGPVLHRSERVGKGGRHFTFLKFRTMYWDPAGRQRVRGLNEKGGHLFKIKRDPRITPVGRVIRRYSIDELPQIINVLRGEMSLLGPRPLPAEDLDPDGLSKEFRAWAEQRATVPPGITGLWQIRGRSDLSFTQMVELDLEYVRKWSLLLDLKILLATPLAILTGKGAY